MMPRGIRVELTRMGRGALFVVVVAATAIFPTVERPVSANAALDPLPNCGPNRNPVPPPPEAVGPPVAGDVSLKLVGQVGGRFKPTVAVGGHLYAGIGNQIVALSLTDPRKPRLVGTSPLLPGVIEDLAASGDRLFAAAGREGLLVLDISTPAGPQLTGSLALPGFAEDVAVSGGFAYVADGPGGLRIVDVGDAAGPVEVGVAYDLHNILGVDVSGGRAFLAAADEGLLVANVSDSSAPAEEGGLLTGGFAYGIDVRRSVAYLADAWGGMRIIDVSSPTAPTRLGRSRTKAWAMDVRVTRSKAYLAAGSQGLRIFDITDSRRPVLLGGRAVRTGHAGHVLVRKGVAYLSDIFAGIRAIDVSRPRRPRVTGGYVPTGTAEHVALHDSYAFVSARTFGARVVDVSDPARPTEVHSLLTSGRDLVLTTSPVGDLAFLTTGLGAARPPTIVTLDISNPDAPVLLSRYEFPGSVRAVAVQGTTLYYPNEFGVVVVDGSRDPPCRLSFLKTSEDSQRNSATGVAVAGDVAYTAISDGGIGVVDVADPREPNLLKTVEHPAFATHSVGNTLFSISDGTNLLESFDISDPLDPVFLDAVELPAGPKFFQAATPLAHAGGKLFVANDNAGLVVVDFSQPENLRIAGRIQLPGRAISVTADTGHAYVASIDGGLSVVRWDPKPQNAATPSSSRGVRNSGSTGPRTPSRNAFTSPRSASQHCVVRARRDSGRGSLRRCLTSSVAGSRITFDKTVFPSEDPARIRLQSELPGIGHPVTIDGSGAGVILDGQGRVATGLSIGGSTVVIGLRIENFTRAGIELGGKRATIRDNVISGNGDFGIFMCCEGTGGRNRIIGNRIGPNPAGTAVAGRQFLGIALGSTGNTIGGTRPRDRNVISGNVIEIEVSSDGNKVIGNYIRTNATGTSVLRAPDANPTIGFTTGARNRFVNNVIAGGIFVSDHGAFYNSFLGNHIGVDATGTTLLDEPHTGLFIGEPYNRAERNLLTTLDLTGSDGVALDNRVLRGAGLSAIEGISSHGGRHNFIGGRSARGTNLLTEQGIKLLEGARDNAVVGNRLDGGDDEGVGLFILGSGQNFIVANEISNAPDAGVLLREDAWENVIRGNELRQSGHGVWIQGARDNVISLNAFFDNTIQATDEGTANLWDFLGLGNFWSDYTGEDADVDGIGDTPRDVPPNGVDRFPLMAPPG